MDSRAGHPCQIFKVGQRFTRWLLKVSDRIKSQTFPLTQEFIAEMLGVRRAGVTETAGKFKEMGLIEYSRADIEITDLKRLEDASCECYMVLRDEYDRLFGLKSFEKEAE